VIKRKENSVDFKNVKRIKSAHPLNLDREKLVQENIRLKTQLNKLENEKINHKREITNLENEIIKKDKIIETMINDTQSNINSDNNKASEMHLVLNVKRQYKELKKAYEKNQQELNSAKKNIKFTKINELNMENKIYDEQIDKLKNLYEHSLEQKQSLQKNVNEFDIMKQALSQKDYIILNFQENCQKMESKIQELNSEKEKLKNQNITKDDMIKKIREKLEAQGKENEQLVMKNNNIKKSEIFLSTKNKYEAKMQKLKKDIAQYRDLNSKHEKILRDIEKNKNNPQKSLQKFSRKIFSSNPQPSYIESSYNTKTQVPSESTQKILLLQSILAEEKNEKEKLLQQVEELTQQLNTSKTIEPKIILANSYSANNIKSEIKVIDYDYLTEAHFNDFKYILLKNLEANKIDTSILESRVLNSDTLDLLKDKTQYKLFISQLGTNFCDILKAKQRKDQEDIYSFINTFLYDNYVSQEKQNPDEFKSKFLALFSKISFYSLEQRQELNKIIAYKLNKNKEKLIELLNYFDENQKGFICFNSINKIIEQLNLKFKNDVKEYFIYVMKCFIDDGNFLQDLKYENILKIVDETPLDPNENYDDVEGGEENKEGDDDAIEITNEEYLAKVKDIISRICKVILKEKKNVDEYFEKIVSKSITDYKAIRLIKLVDVLKDEFNIELSNIEIFCLFTKVKPNLGASKDPDDVEEIIDYTKLKEEIENYLRHPEKQSTSITPNEPKDTKKKSIKDLNSQKLNQKLDYSDILDHAPKESYNSGTFDLKKILVNFMEKHKFNFERFIFPVHCMMKLASDNKFFNRYLDVEFFKHFLYQNGILVQNVNLMEYIGNNKLLYNNEKINIDYLKYIISSDDGKTKEIKDNNNFITYKPIKRSIKISNVKGLENVESSGSFEEAD
jgi:hypothetical protein